MNIDVDSHFLPSSSLTVMESSSFITETFPYCSSSVLVNQYMDQRNTLIPFLIPKCNMPPKKRKLSNADLQAHKSKQLNQEEMSQQDQKASQNTEGMDQKSHLEDARERLQRYEKLDDDDKTDKILSDILDFLSPGGRACLVADILSKSDKDLGELVRDFRLNLMIPCKYINFQISLVMIFIIYFYI